MPATEPIASHPARGPQPAPRPPGRAAPHLQRTPFTVAREREYFDADELSAQTGQAREEFFHVVLKELLDNALDAAETAGVAPAVAVTVVDTDDAVELTVADNGPGLAPDVLDRILDFATRTSDKARYRSPTRGAQGNALKTVVGIPTALQPHGTLPAVVIEACGVRHTITPHRTAAGNVRIERRADPGPAAGTTVTVAMPRAGLRIEPERWVRAFALVNPHAGGKIERIDRRTAAAQLADDEDAEDADRLDFSAPFPAMVAFPAAWTKWLPGDPTSPHWYDAGALQALIDAEVEHAAGGEGKKLKDFVAEFRGLTGRAKARAVAAAVPRATRLADLAPEDTPVLLAAMRRASTPPKAKVLGEIGEAPLRAGLERAFGPIPDERFWYRRVVGEADGVPFVVEAAVAEPLLLLPPAAGPIFAVNFSPTFADPLADTVLRADKAAGRGLAGLLQDCHVEDDEGLVAVVHLVSPALTFLDRGKAKLAPSPALTAAATRAVWLAAKTAWHEGERRERDFAAYLREKEARQRRLARGERKRSQFDVAAEVMEEAWHRASSGGERRVSARTVFYQARPLMQAISDMEISDSRFIGVLLPRYQQKVRKLPGVYYEPRGVLHEPHAIGRHVPLGTVEVDGYTFPPHLFDKMLFVEKTGLWPVFEQDRLAERYDMAIIAGSGFATVAARELLARAERDCRIFVAHDADPAGYNIAATIAEETARMPDHRIEVIDLGLTLDDAAAWGLATETFARSAAVPSRLQLGERERQMWHPEQRASKTHPVLCERVELNAFISALLIAYFEAKLRLHGATAKVVPPAPLLRCTAEAALVDAMEGRVRAALAAVLPIEPIAEAALARAALDPTALDPAAVRAALERARERDWRAVAAGEGKRAALAVPDAVVERAVRAALAAVRSGGGSR